MIIKIPPEPTFQVPEGKYRAILKDVIHLENRKTKNGWEDQVRLLFELKSCKSNVQYMAGKNYEPSLSKGSELRHDLESWRGHDFTEAEIQAGDIDLDSMIGQEADVSIGHIHNEGYPQPFVHIKAIQSPGTWIADQS